MEITKIIIKGVECVTLKGARSITGLNERTIIKRNFKTMSIEGQTRKYYVLSDLMKFVKD